MINTRDLVATNNGDDHLGYSPDEWVEIIEPKSKQRIYANLDSGVCAKDPPKGAHVSRSEDFTDHWWELYDEKTHKFYYYNPEQQRTAWTKPKESNTNNNGAANNKNNQKKRLLIIPVSRLQTFKKMSSNEQIIEKCDASTQTIASNSVSIGTQTTSRDYSLEDEFDNKCGLVDSTNESFSKSNSSFTNSSTENAKTSSFKPNHRKHLDGNKTAAIYSSNLPDKIVTTSKQAPPRPPANYEYLRASKNKNKSSQLSQSFDKPDDASNCDNYTSYFGINQKEHATISIKSPTHYSHNSRSNDNYMSSTSTFVNPSSRVEHSRPPQQKIVTNNLTHYLVREARAMGIALISDDDMEDDDPDSDEDCIVDEDEDTDLRDDLSSNKDDLNASQELVEDSSEGWKSFSDQDSPNNANPESSQMNQTSPLHCETSPSFAFNNLDLDPSTSVSQHLNHQKLVDNFRKSRQTSSLGVKESSNRNLTQDSNYAMHMMKTTMENFISMDGRDHMSDKHLRQLSALSTLPRPNKETKDKIALSKQEDSGSHLDADYDVVEENCGYYSDSERNQLNNSSSNSKITSKMLGAPQQALNGNFDRNKISRGSTFSVESFARENLTRHPKKGSLLFNRKVKWSRMISWTKNSIKQPMISSVNSDLNSDSINSFKLIQQFMGDRKVTITKKYRQVIAESSINNDEQQSSGGKGKNTSRSYSLNTSTSSQFNSRNSTILPDRLRDELAYELVVKGCLKTALRDEIYVQMARQLTENPNQESVRWGMVLMSILLSYFSPSNKFSPFLLSFLETYSHQMAQDVCLPRLEKRLRQNYLTYCRKPADGREISIIRLSITKWPQYCGVFGESLERLMSLQSCSTYLKTLRLPWILTTLGNKLMKCGASETEGIFRCAADHDLIAQLRLEIDCVDFRKITDPKQVDSLLSNVQDPHVIAGLLKMFFRQLNEPIFPTSLYELCLKNSLDAQMACCIFDEHLPNLNKDVVAYLINLLQTLSQEDKVTFTKMDSSNLSMVWAPNLLKAPDCCQQDVMESKNGSKWSIINSGQHGEEQSSLVTTASQSNIFEQTRQEMQFIRSLINQLDTSFIKNVI